MGNPARPARPARLASALARSAAGRPALLAGLVMAALGAQAAPLADGQTLPTGIDAPSPTGAGSTLDRTLQVDTNAAQRDVELLLETRGTSEREPPPATRRPPALSAPGVAAPARSTGPEVERPPVAEPVPESVREVFRTLREHRYWLLGALGLVAALAVFVQLWQRYRAGAAERRLRALAGQQRPSRGRHRSSRH